MSGEVEARPVDKVATAARFRDLCSTSHVVERGTLGEVITDGLPFASRKHRAVKYALLFDLICLGIISFFVVGQIGSGLYVQRSRDKGVSTAQGNVLDMLISVWFIYLCLTRGNLHGISSAK